MLPSHRSVPNARSALASTTGIAVRILCIAAIALAFCLLAGPVPLHASTGSLPTGTVTNQVSQTCPGGQWLPGMSCFSALLTCPSALNVDPLTFTYGQLIPSGTVKGIVVYLDGGDGNTAVGEEPEYEILQYYAAQNYGVVEIAWSSAWEQTSIPNIQNAACRPATFLSYVYNNVYLPIASGNGVAGMCAQGFSAGSAAVAYSLAYYGAWSYLDNVELISGPVLSDIKRGCEQNPPSVTVCGAGQYGCRMGGDSPWILPPTYVPNGVNYIDHWTNSNTCTTGTNPQWLNESIVDQSTGQSGQGAVPTFSYPSTAMSAWLCSNVDGQPPSCSGSNYNYNVCPNNSSSQGEIFYSQFTAANAPPVFNIYAVNNCVGPEGVPQGAVPYLTGGELVMSGVSAIEQDMAGGVNTPAQCFHGPHN